VTIDNDFGDRCSRLSAVYLRTYRCLSKLAANYPAFILALHGEEPERISRLFDETIAELAVRGYAAGAVSPASSRRPSRPSVDALSWAISYSRVAYPE
jgi:hypothetical protein